MERYQPERFHVKTRNLNRDEQLRKRSDGGAGGGQPGSPGGFGPDRCLPGCMQLFGAASVPGDFLSEGMNEVREPLLSLRQSLLKMDDLGIADLVTFLSEVQ